MRHVTVVPMKARNSLIAGCNIENFDGCKEKRVIRKKTENFKNIFFKALANRFLLTKLFMVNFLSNGLHEKVMICHFCLESPLGNNFGQQMKEKRFDQNF